MNSLTLISAHIYIYTHSLVVYYVKCCQCILKTLAIMVTWVEIPGPLPQQKAGQRPGNIASVSTGHSRASSGGVPGSLVLRLRPQLFSQNKVTWEVYSGYTYPWTLSCGSLTCLTTVPMVTSLMPRINFLMSYCAYVSSTEWWDGTGSFEVPTGLTRVSGHFRR